MAGNLAWNLTPIPLPSNRRKCPQMHAQVCLYPHHLYLQGPSLAPQTVGEAIQTGEEVVAGQRREGEKGERIKGGNYWERRELEGAEDQTPLPPWSVQLCAESEVEVRPERDATERSCNQHAHSLFSITSSLNTRKSLPDEEAQGKCWKGHLRWTHAGRCSPDQSGNWLLAPRDAGGYGGGEEKQRSCARVSRCWLKLHCNGLLVRRTQAATTLASGMLNWGILCWRGRWADVSCSPFNVYVSNWQ